jgi:hypothetical protein
MIVIPVGNYKLTQIEGSGIIKVFHKGEYLKTILNMVLTSDTAKAIIQETGR